MDFFLHSLLSLFIGTGNQCIDPNTDVVVKYHNCAVSTTEYGDPFFDLNGVRYTANFLF